MIVDVFLFFNLCADHAIVASVGALQSWTSFRPRRVKLICRMAAGQQNESSGERKVGKGSLCPIGMVTGRPCGRPLHDSPSAVDKVRVCLMHSADPQKNDAEFQREFDRILRDAGNGVADFSSFVFLNSNYGGRSFSARCLFAWVTFMGDANFNRAKFTRVNFNVATFTRDANFDFATFSEEADFSFAKFAQNANFKGDPSAQDNMFAKNATFESALFVGAAHFHTASFGKIADFRRVQFLGAAGFGQTKFRHDPQSQDPEPSAIFCDTVFDKPERVVFYQTDLVQALFHNCDVSKVSFSDVTWRRRKNGRSMVFDEVIDPEFSITLLGDEVVNSEHSNNRAPTSIFFAEALRSGKSSTDTRNYRLIEELYQKLQRNYDAQADYRLAGDFHYGEMESKRHRSHNHNILLRRLHSTVGLVACYKYASEYGESYTRPGMCLLSVLLAFTLLYPISGLYRDTGRTNAPNVVSAPAKPLTYWQPFQGSGDSRSVWSARRDLVGHSLVTALYLAAFQRDIVYEPSYPWGRLLALLETLLTSTLAALFLLAVRRQFKR